MEEFYLYLIPLVVPVFCNYIKKVLNPKWTPYIAGLLGILFLYAVQMFTGSEFVIWETTLEGLALGLCGVGVREIAKNPMQFFKPKEEQLNE